MGQLCLRDRLHLALVARQVVFVSLVTIVAVGPENVSLIVYDVRPPKLSYSYVLSTATWNRVPDAITSPPQNAYASFHCGRTSQDVDVAFWARRYLMRYARLAH